MWVEINEAQGHKVTKVKHLGSMGPKFGVSWRDVGWGQQDPKFGVNGGQNWGSMGPKPGVSWRMWVGVNKPNNADVAVAALLSTYG